MDGSLDPITDQQIQEFQKYLDAIADFHKAKMMHLAKDRMREDLEVCFQQEIPIRRVSRAHGLIHRIGANVRKVVLRRNYPGYAECIEKSPTIIVIEPGQASRLTRVPRPDHTRTERSDLDV